MITQSNLNQVVQTLKDFEARVNAFELPAEQDLRVAKSEFATLFGDFSRALEGLLADAEAAGSEILTEISQQTSPVVQTADVVDGAEADEAVAIALLDQKASAPIDFKIKFRSATHDPMSGLPMYSAILIADDGHMVRSGSHHSKADLNDDLNLMMAEMNASRSGETRTVAVNYGTELVAVAPDGTHTKVLDDAIAEFIEG